MSVLVKGGQWYRIQRKNGQGRFMLCAGFSWSDSGATRVMAFEVTGHDVPRAEVHNYTPNAWKRMKPEKCERPTVNHHDVECGDAVEDCERRVKEESSG